MGADGELWVEVEHQEFALVNSGDVVNASVGSTAYFASATSVSIDSSTDSRPVAGIITQLEGDLCGLVLPWRKPWQFQIT